MKVEINLIVLYCIVKKGKRTFVECGQFQCKTITVAGGKRS